MNATSSLVLVALLGMSTFAASAQTAAGHAHHHPSGAAATPAQAAPAQAAPAQAAPATPEPQTTAVDKQLQLMRDMSRKLADAKTPQERQALMAEHHKAMQDGMKMLDQMQGTPMQGMGKKGGAGQADGAQTMGGMMQRHAMMEKRMEMMQTMMQMMMDRLPAPAAR